MIYFSPCTEILHNIQMSGSSGRKSRAENFDSACPTIFHGSLPHLYRLQSSPFNRNGAASSSPLLCRNFTHVSTRCYTRRNTNGDVARLKSAAAAAEIMNGLDLRKIRQCVRAREGLFPLYLFISLRPSTLDLLCSNDGYKFFYKYLLFL